MNDIPIMNKMPVISAFITNLGKYNEGELIGKWHDFPTTREEIARTFKEIDIDGVRYEEFFITDYDINIEGIYDNLSEYENLNEINYLASKIAEMDRSDLEKYEAIISYGDYCSSLKNLINLTENLDCYDYIEGILNDYDLGYYWINDSGCYDIKSMGQLYSYFDYESFGRDITLDESGAYTANGYIRSNGDTFYTEYDGVNIPDEYKIFAIPKTEQKLIKTLNM